MSLSPTKMDGGQLGLSRVLPLEWTTTWIGDIQWRGSSRDLVGGEEEVVGEYKTWRVLGKERMSCFEQ